MKVEVEGLGDTHGIWHLASSLPLKSIWSNLLINIASDLCSQSPMALLIMRAHITRVPERLRIWSRDAKRLVELSVISHIVNWEDLKLLCKVNGSEEDHRYEEIETQVWLLHGFISYARTRYG